MLYLYAGSDRVKAREKWLVAVKNFKDKHPEAELFGMTAETFNPAVLNEYIIGQTLFAKKYVVVLDELSANKEFEGDFNPPSGGRASLWQLMDESPNIFIVFEGKIAAPIKKKLEKLEGKINLFELAETGKGKNTGAREYGNYNIFAFTDYFAARDRKNLWVEYQKALRADIPAEEIFWKLVWQVKNLLYVAKVGKAPKGMHPFVAEKTARAAKNFSVEELSKLSSNLLDTYHAARRGEVEFGVEVERMILVN